MNNERILAVDLGGTKLLIGQTDSNGKRYSPQRFSSTIGSVRNTLNNIIRSIKIYLEKYPQARQVSGIGISAVGWIDFNKGIWHCIDPNKKEDINARQEIENIFHITVTIANDVYCATTAELYKGAGNVTKNFIYLNLGTGIAGRIVDDGRIIVGKHYNAGEIGHMIVDLNSPVIDSCGSYGCVESFASGLGMSNEAIRLMKNDETSRLTINAAHRVTGQDLFIQYEKGDRVATQVVNHAAAGIAALIQNLVVSSDPDEIVLGGGLSNNQKFIDLVKKQLNPVNMRLLKLGVHMSSLNPNEVAFVGASINCWKMLAERRDSDEKNRRGFA